MVLEDYEHARTRNAEIYAEILGSGAAIVADENLSGKLAPALAQAMRLALANAGRQPATIGHISAHGLATPASDREEAAAIGEVFGPAAADVPLVAAKSFFGNLGAGSGVVELAASILSFTRGRLYPTLNYDRPDPSCPVNVNTDDQTLPGDTCLAINVTPQGQAAALVAAAIDHTSRGP